MRDMLLDNGAIQNSKFKIQDSRFKGHDAGWREEKDRGVCHRPTQTATDQHRQLLGRMKDNDGRWQILDSG